MSEDVNEIVVEEPYGFIYITTNMVNGKRYLGQKKFDNYWKNYFGSGTIFRKALNKYGKENFVRNVIDIAFSKEELNQKEYDYSIFFNVVKSDDWYNMVVGGGVTYGQNPYANKTEEEMEKIRKKKSELSSGTNNPMYGKHHTEETKKKISNIHKLGMLGEKNPFYGHHHSKETKEKLKEINIGRKATSEMKQKMSESNTGYKNPRATPIFCLELNRIFWGATEAAEIYGFSRQNIGQCCYGKNKHCGRHPETNELLSWMFAIDAVNKCYITQNQLDEYLNNIKEERN